MNSRPSGPGVHNRSEQAFTVLRIERSRSSESARFTAYVAARHATLTSGWWAAPLPDGSRTRWLVGKGFSSSHPPPQGLPWRNLNSERRSISVCHYLARWDECWVPLYTSEMERSLPRLF